MTAKEALEKYKHFDNIWSDREWMHPEPDEEDSKDSSRLARMMSAYVYDLWAAVKDAAKEQP